MPPENPAPNYDFILNHPAPKKSLFGGGKSQRTILVVVGGLVLVLFIVLGFMILGNVGKGNTQDLIAVTQQQNEVSRIAKKAALVAAASSSTRGKAETIALSVDTSKQQFLAALKKHRVKVSAKELALKQSAETDTKLTAAAESNTFDKVFSEVITQDLKDYQQALKTAYDHSPSGNDKQLLNTTFLQTNLLITKLSQ
ncbi:MAG: hypothetical protein JWS12_3 [Candidatus Saccharibacteria bacterium]|nr:hypothetical protein [Candidatus Saccharibacteria bacterium]